MKAVAFPRNEKPVICEVSDASNASKFHWIIAERNELDGLLAELKNQDDFELHPEHYEDCFNPMHPCFFDAMDNYKFLIYRSVNLNAEGEIDAHSVAFILQDHRLITVHENEPAIDRWFARFESFKRSPPQTPQALLYQLLVSMTDQFLSLRDTMAAKFADWQEQLLGNGARFESWREFLDYKSAMQRVYMLCEGQFDAVEQWQQEIESEDEKDEHYAHVHLSDLESHIKRGLKFSQQLQYQIDSLMQLHYSLMTSVTNRVMQLLTVISAIFLPLTLITGIFGMNFERMPLLKHHNGFYIIILFMLIIIGGLLSFFKRRRWV